MNDSDGRAPDDSSTDGAITDFDNRMSYSDYLDLERLLGAQHPVSTAHDELLFIIQHQTSELWLHLALHELRSARQSLADDRVEPAFKMLSRVARIFEQLNGAWDVLRTMTPSDYTQFREARPVVRVPVVPVPQIEFVSATAITRC